MGLCSLARRTINAWAVALLVMLAATPAKALVVELDDVAPDRIERQRAFTRGTLPTSPAPDLAELPAELEAKGIAEGAPILIRIFKAESELELWMRKGANFTLMATYPVCHWTGTLGPKLREGDKQSPEGFYMIGAREMRHRGRWRDAFNLGFPNLHDKRLDRTGSYILVHGGCSSTGCYAMTEPVQKVIYRLAASALKARQPQFQVHVFPFRMTDANMVAHADHPWMDFWRDLKAGYDAFEATRLPPRIGVCGQRYTVARAAPGVSSDGPMTRVVPGTPGAAGFDTSRCGIPIVQPSEMMADLSAATPGDDALLAEAMADADARTVARVQRLDAAGAKQARAGKRAEKRMRSRAHRRNWQRTKEARRLRREALGQAAGRTMLGYTP